MNGWKYETNLKPRNSDGETNDYDTTKMSIIKELNATGLSMNPDYISQKLKLILKQLQ